MSFSSLAIIESLEAKPVAPTLNTPTDTSTVTTGTPNLVFTGTDPESDAIEYQIQIDTKNTFDSGTPQYTWDLTYASYTGKSFSVTTQQTVPTDLSFNADGTKMYVIGAASSNIKMYQYNLSTAWDVSTASYASISYDFSPSDSLTLGMYFRADGSKLYICSGPNPPGSNSIKSYTLSTPWDITTITYDSKSFSFASQETYSYGIEFTSDGTQMWMTGEVNDRVNHYTLSTAWDVTTASFTAGDYISVAAVETRPYKVKIDPTGTKMFITGIDFDCISQYSLSTPWDVKTATYVRNIYIGDKEGFPYGLYFKSDGTAMYFIGEQNDKVWQYSLGVAQPLYNKYSDVDVSSFTNLTNGAHTHPFPSGEQIQYAVQSGGKLSDGVYYWRAAGKDPSGSDAYGIWPSAFSFTVAIPFVVSGTSADLTSGTVKMAVNSTIDNTHTSTIAGDGSWSISGATKPNSGDAITVFVSDADESTKFKSTAVTTYSGANAIGGMVLNKHVLSIGSDQNRSIVLSDLAKYDYDQDTHIIHSANGSPATLLMKFANGSSYVDEKIDILAGNTLTVGATETLTTYNLTIDGTLISSGASTYNVAHNWANNGTFTAGSSTVNLNGTAAAQTLSGTLNSTSAFYNLTITNNYGTSASDDERTSWVPGIDFNVAAKITNNYTITTANVRVEYQSGATYEFANINWNGQATGSRIYFRNSDTSTTWLLKVTGTQMAVSYINVSRSDASVSGGSSIFAFDGTNHDSGNNTSWLFKNIRVRQEICIMNGAAASQLTPTNTSVGISSISPNYSGTLTNYFEVVATNTDSSDLTVYLRNWVGDAIIAQLVVPHGTTVPTIFRSSPFILPVSLTQVYTNFPGTTVAGQLTINASRVIVYQDTGLVPLTMTETQIEIGNYESAQTFTTATPLNYPKYWFYDATHWDNTKTFYAETAYRTTSTTRTVTVTLQKDNLGDMTTWSDVVIIVNAQGSSPANYPMLSSRVAFTPVNGCNYRITTFISSTAGGNTYTVYNTKIIVDQISDSNILNDPSSTSYYSLRGAGQTNAAYVQSFVLYKNDTLTGVTMRLKVTGAPADSLTMSLRLAQDGTTLASGTIAASSLLTTVATYTINFSAPYTVTAGNTYVIQIDRTGAGDLNNYYGLQVNAATLAVNPYKLGAIRAKSSTAVWGADDATYDFYMIFEGAVINGISKLEPQYLLQTTNSAATGLQNYDTSWSAFDWVGTSNTYYHEINSSTDTADSAKLQSDPNGSPADVTGSVATGAKRARSGALTMPATTTLDTYISNTPIYASRIIVFVNMSTSVVLNSPTDGQVIAGTTPTLNFTGTSIGAYNLEYNVRINTSGSFNFTALGVSADAWQGISVNSINGDVYACAFGGDIYRQIAGKAGFNGLSTALYDWYGVAVNSSNGDVYACVASGYIYKQTGGAGSFAQQTLSGVKNWYGVAVNSSNGDVYACVYGGSIWKQAGGSGSYVDQVTGNKNWNGISVNPLSGDVYACVYGGSIWKQTASTGSFVDLVAGNKNWDGISVNSNNGDVYACVYGGDIYQLTAGVSGFTALGAGTQNWTGVAVSSVSGAVYACANGGDIYNLPSISSFSVTNAGFTTGHPFTSSTAVDYTVPVGGLDDSYSETNQNGARELYSGLVTKVGQSFTSQGGDIQSVKFYLKKIGAPTGNMVATLYAHTGTYGSTGKPTGSILATTRAVDVSTLTTSYQLLQLEFNSVYALTAGSYYFVCLEYSGGNASNYVEMGMVGGGSQSHSGNSAYYSGASWSDYSDQDGCFYVYTVDRTLSPGTYYWQASAIETTRGNYGDWSNTRSFTIPYKAPSNMVQYKANHSAVIATGGSTSDGVSNNDYLDFAVTGNEVEIVTPKIEVRNVSTAFTGATIATGDSFSFNPSVPRYRVYPALIYDSANKRMIMFGGKDTFTYNNTFYNDVWEMKLPTATNPNPVWNQLSGLSGGPSARYRMTYVYDSKYQRMIIFGGEDSGGDSSPLGGFYSLSLVSGAEAWTSFTPSSTLPSNRFTAPAIFVPDGSGGDGRMVMYGGWTGAADSNEVWQITLPSNLASSSSLKLTPTGSITGRSDASLVYDSINARAVLFGGWATPRYNEAWQLTLPGPGVNGAWTLISTSGSAPAARNGHSAVLDTINQRMVVYMGWNGTDYFNDIFDLDLSTMQWTNRTSSTGTLLGGRYGVASIYDSFNKRAVIFGGTNAMAAAYGPGINQSIVVDTSTVSSVMYYDELAPTVNLTGADGTIAVYDDTNQQWIRVGGYSRIYDPAYPDVTGYHVNETWAYSVTTNQLDNISSPVSYIGREVTNAVYDSYNKRVIMFGGLGYGGDISLSDLWQMSMDSTSSDYKVWKRLSASNTTYAPSPRWGSAVIYDPVNQRMILFSGENITVGQSDTSDLNIYTLSLTSGSESWASVGNGITLSGSFSPSVTQGLFQSKAIYDPVNVRMVIYGGRDEASVYYNNVWSLDWDNGTPNAFSWQSISVSGTPPTGTRGHTAIYQGDFADKRMIIFGGWDGTTHYNSVAKLDITSTNPVWSQITTLGTPPVLRRSGNAIYDPVNQRMIIQGGRGALTPINWTKDFWELTLPSSTSSWTWTRLYPDTYLKASVPITGLSVGVSYHWQAWSTGSNSGDSRLSPYGGNSDTVTADTDFVIIGVSGIKVWDGSWNYKPVKVWNGGTSSWEIKPVKVWNGGTSSWEIKG